MNITLMLLLIVLLCLQPSLVPAVGNRDALATSSRGGPRGYYAEHYKYQRANPKLVPSNLPKSHVRLSDARYDRSEGSLARVESDTTTRFPPPKPEDVKVFVGVFTAPTPPNTPKLSKFDYFARRQTLRATWGRRVLPYSHMVVRFIVGVNPDPVLHAAMLEEATRYGDVLVLDTQDTYAGLTNKTRATFGHALRSYPNLEWVVKMDDDAFLLPERLLMAVDQYAAIGADYISCLWSGPTFPMTHRWGEPNRHLIGESYTTRGLGTLYVISGRVLKAFVQPKYDHLRLSGSCEDAAIGVWMLASNAVFFDDHRLCTVACNNGSVAVYDKFTQGLPLRFWPLVNTDPACTARPPWPMPYQPAYVQGLMAITK